MAVVVEEYFRARRGDAYTERERVYLVTGTEEHADLDEYTAIFHAANASPTSLLSTDASAPLARTNAAIERFISNSQALVTVRYGEAGGAGLAVPPADTVEYEFNYQAPSVQIYQSLQTRSVSWVGGGIANPGSIFNGAIGVQDLDGTRHIEGTSTAPGNTTSTWTFTKSFIDSDYESTVENLMGCVNLQPFKGRPIGSMRFVSCSSQTALGQSKTSIRFGFQYEQNTTSLSIGGIAVVPPSGQPAKYGHDYLWIYRRSKPIAMPEGGESLLPTPQYVIVERVFRYADLNQLGF